LDITGRNHRVRTEGSNSAIDIIAESNRFREIRDNPWSPATVVDQTGLRNIFADRSLILAR
jgi:hypothetical protein